MSTDGEHLHAFARDMTGKCICGMTAEEYEQQRAAKAAIGQQDTTAAFKIPKEFAGSIIIDWGKSPFPAVITELVSITNAETGQLILTATELHVHAVMGHTVVAELLTLADADGEPILDVPHAEINARMSVDEKGNIATTTSWWHVAEMRIGA